MEEIYFRPSCFSLDEFVKSLFIRLSDQYQIWILFPFYMKARLFNLHYLIYYNKAWLLYSDLSFFLEGREEGGIFVVFCFNQIMNFTCCWLTFMWSYRWNVINRFVKKLIFLKLKKIYLTNIDKQRVQNDLGKGSQKSSERFGIFICILLRIRLCRWENVLNHLTHNVRVCKFQSKWNILR